MTDVAIAAFVCGPGKGQCKCNCPEGPCDHDFQRYAEGVMTDEVTQLAHGRVEREFEEYNTLHETEIEKLLVSFGAEVQRQTVEAACRLLCPYCEYGMPAYPLNGVKTSNGKPFWHQDQFDHNLYHECKAAPIRALLSSAQEVRRGFC